MINQQPTESVSHRLGRTNFWMNFDAEDHGLSHSWRMSVYRKYGRVKKGRVDTPLLDVSPRKPLLTLNLGGETFPLFIANWEKRRGGFHLSGSRPLRSGGAASINWEAVVNATATGKRAQLDFDFAIRITPRSRSNGEIRIHLPLQLRDPFVAESEVAEIRGHRAMVAWEHSEKLAVSYCRPPSCTRDGIFEPDGFHATIPLSEIGARKKLTVSLGFSEAGRGHDAKALLLLHYASVCPPSAAVPSPPAPDLRQDASLAVSRLVDKGSYDVVGMDRAYPCPPCPPEDEQSFARTYIAGYPYFPVEAMRSLLDWTRFVNDEPVLRVAKLCARGIAMDFPHIIQEDDIAKNKGAFWDRRKVVSGKLKSENSGFDDEPKFSLLSNARTARAMLDMYERAKEHVFQHTGLNATRWLMLRQNHTGYYAGDRYDLEGVPTGGPRGMAGVEAIPAYVGAFRLTDNEVYIKAAWRIARYVIEEILPHHPAPSTLPGSMRTHMDSPVGLAALVRAFISLDSEAPNRRLREALSLVASRLRVYPFDRLDDPEFNFDCQWGGLYECAFAAFGMFNLTREAHWLQLGLSLVSAVPADGRGSWRSIPAYIQSMCAVASLARDLSVSQTEIAISRAWRKYEPDTAAHDYVRVEAADSDAIVDLLCLVSKADNQTLVLVLADSSVKDIYIKKNRRRPVLYDVRQRCLISGKAPLHKMPFDGPWRYGIFTINT